MALSRLARSPGDPHSHARLIEFARVTDIHLELNVDFDRKVLKGKAILTVEGEQRRNNTLDSDLSNELILDSHGLVILSVKDIIVGFDLYYEFGRCKLGKLGKLGSKFTIWIYFENDDFFFNRKIQIEYETSPTSPSLYWLKPEQTADGLHPFLLSNNMLTYARSWFPCQDTPSAKFTYSATIVAPVGFKVLMSAALSENKLNSHESVYKFSQEKPVPSYAVVIAVGVLEYEQLSSKIGIWTENKYITLSKQTFRETENMLQIAENLCGDYPWDSLDICVLPPSVSHFEIECPRLIFVSATLLGGDISLVSSIARNISQNWTGILVTCEKYKHLWLNKSFTLFIYRRILEVLLGDDIKQFIGARDLDVTRTMIKYLKSRRMLKCLLDDMTGSLPDELIEFVPYEKGYMLLVELQSILGGSTVFEAFLRSYLTNFAYSSTKTDGWKEHLYNYFPNKLHELDAFDWDFWFDDPKAIQPGLFDTTKLKLEEVCHSLAEKWIKWNDSTQSPFTSTDIEDFCDVQKIYFLNHLHRAVTILSKRKMDVMESTYQFDGQNDEIRFVWLRLCIRSRWMVKVPTALNFAIKFCSPKFTYPIFEDLYNWSDAREAAIEKYTSEGWKMLDEIKKKVASILRVNENVHEMVDKASSNVDFHT